MSRDSRGGPSDARLRQVHSRQLHYPLRDGAITFISIMTGEQLNLHGKSYRSVTKFARGSSTVVLLARVYIYIVCMYIYIYAFVCILYTIGEKYVVGKSPRGGGGRRNEREGLLVRVPWRNTSLRDTAGSVLLAG